MSNASEMQTHAFLRIRKRPMIKNCDIADRNNNFHLMCRSLETARSGDLWIENDLMPINSGIRNEDKRI